MFEAFLVSPFILRAIIAVFLISILSAFVGSLAIFRESTFLVAGVAHAALAGAAFGILLSLYQITPYIDAFTGALIFAILVALFVGTVTLKSEKASVDVAIGTAFAFSMSIAVALISMIKEYATVAWGLLIGDLLLLSEKDILYLIVLTTIVMFTTLIFLREFLFVAFDMESATAYGIRVGFYHYLMLLLISTSVVVILKGVGAILVYALLTIPPAAANEIGKSTTSVIIIAFIISLFSGLLGLYIAFFVDIAPSGITGLIVTTIYMIVFIWKRVQLRELKSH
ncbi:MAG: metal ABC transporter permease [Candidatus Odinarchaeota archaeon]|nr:metal ABC transporter permease [Candidatus Odinarchaeota archaeon]